MRLVLLRFGFTRAGIPDRMDTNKGIWVVLAAAAGLAATYTVRRLRVPPPFGAHEPKQAPRLNYRFEDKYQGRVPRLNYRFNQQKRSSDGE